MPMIIKPSSSSGGGEGGGISSWNELQDKPISTVIDIDDAVSKKHEHDNSTAIDLISTDNNNNFLWNGQPFTSGVDMSRYDSDDDGIIDTAATLQGLLSTITELNYLTNANSNIQAQIDLLSNIANFTGSVDTKANLSNIIDPNVNDMAIVLEDEDNNDTTSIYMFDGTSWIYAGEFKAELRDFNLNPIDLRTEITGILDESLIDSTLIRKTEFSNSIASIDDAVDKKHSHSNIAALNNINIDSEGLPLWGGNEWPGSGSGISSVSWTDVNNRPNSLVTDIDDAVDKKHNHTNKNILDNLNETLDGDLTYKGLNLAIGDMKKAIYDTTDTGIVDKAETLHNLTASIVELNYVGGVTSNIQSQINALSNVANFTGTVTNYSDLSNISNPTSNDMTIVIEDENNNDSTTIYIYNGTNWVYVGEFKAELRDFALYPINLNTEVTGILDESLIDASLIRTTDFTSSISDIEDAVDKKHEHSNINTLGKITETLDGLPLWNGSEWPGTASSLEWSSITNTPTALTKITEDVDGNPLWNGTEWPGGSGGDASIDLIIALS